MNIRYISARPPDNSESLLVALRLGKRKNNDLGNYRKQNLQVGETPVTPTGIRVYTVVVS